MYRLLFLFYSEARQSWVMAAAKTSLTARLQHRSCDRMFASQLKKIGRSLPRQPEYAVLLVRRRREKEFILNGDRITREVISSASRMQKNRV